MDIKLTIAIPTFDRCAQLERQLRWLQGAGHEFANEIEVLISNNCSTDGTAELLKLVAHSLPGNVRIVNQVTNLGLIGNYRYVVGAAAGRYIWVLSDDDGVKDGAIDAIFEGLNHGSPGLLHLGWGVAEIDDSAGSCKALVEAYYGYHVMALAERDHASCLKMALREFGGLMLMSANVLDVSAARRALERWTGSYQNLALPLWVAAHCSWAGGFCFDKRTWIYCRHGDTRWASEGRALFLGDVPRVQQELARIGASRWSIVRSHLGLVTREFFRFAVASPFAFVLIWGGLPFRLLRKPLKS